MKLLFVHDHPFFIEEQNVVYTGGSFPKSIWSNYLSNFESITVYARKSRSQKSKNAISSCPRVDFYLTEKYNSISNYYLNRKDLITEIEYLIKSNDVILVRLPSMLGFLAAKIAKRFNKFIWVEQVGNAKEALSNHGSIVGKISANYFDFKNKKIVKYANFVTFVTENKLQNDYPPSLEAISIALSDVVIPSVLHKYEVDHRRFFSSELHLAVIGGFDARYKGQDVLLKAISLLDKEMRNRIKISFIGKGDSSWLIKLSEELKIRNNIAFIGSIKSGASIFEYLKKISIYIQPSLTEGMPRALIEAMSMGCPVLGSNVGGIPDVVNKSFIHKKGDYRVLSNHIKNLFNDRDMLCQESLRSLELASGYKEDELKEKRIKFFTLMNSYITKY